MDLGISGKIVLVTGGGRGIGKAVSETFSNLGATVIINYNKNKEPAESLTKKLGNGSLCIKADVSKSADVKQMFDTNTCSSSSFSIFGTSRPGHSLHFRGYL